MQEGWHKAPCLLVSVESKQIDALFPGGFLMAVGWLVHHMGLVLGQECPLRIRARESGSSSEARQQK